MGMWIPGQAPEGISRGMNSRDSAKTLPREVGQLLKNAFPGKPAKPRHGMTDKFTSLTQLGYGTNDSLFRGEGVYFRYADKDFFIALAHSTADATEYHLEVWNATDDNRTSILSADMPNSDEYAGFHVLSLSIKQSAEQFGKLFHIDFLMHFRLPPKFLPDILRE